MLKKAITVIVFVGVIGVLIFGAVNRTQARSEKEQGGRGAETVASTEFQTLEGQGRGRGQSTAAEQAAAATDLAPQRGRQNQSQSTATELRGRQGQSETANTEQRSRQGQSGAGQPLAEAEEHDWLNWSGVVVTMDAETLIIESANGEQVEISGRPWSFAQESGFTAQVGDALNLRGFDEDGEFEVGAFINQSSGQEVQIREESGRPLWAGRGRQAGG